MLRGFQVISVKESQKINLPKRQTKQAAGYDFESAEDFVVPSIWKLNFVKIIKGIFNNSELSNQDYEDANSALKPVLVPTGIKAYMPNNEFLMLVNRSSGPLKRRLILPNGVGVVDADYYNNEANEGELFFQLINYGVKDVVIKKGERIGQGIFMPFLTADDEEQPQSDRVGGFGSTKK